MVRPLRVEYEGAVYHILSRGNQGEQIFSDDGGDKEYFIEILHRAVQRYGIEVYAYGVMWNHYHLLIINAGVRTHKGDALYRVELRDFSAEIPWIDGPCLCR